MKASILLLLFIFVIVDIQAQEFLHFTDVYLSGGYRNQPYTALNQKLESAGYQSFNSHVGVLGIGINYFNSSRWGVFAETEYNLNTKRSENEQINYRYLPVHGSVGIQYKPFMNRKISQWTYYPRIAFFYGTTSLDLIANDINRNFDDNLMGSMNTSFLYQRNYGLNLSLNADKVFAAFIKPTTQVGIYSRMGLQVGYIANLVSGRTRLRRNFKSDFIDNYAVFNAPQFDPSTFYIKLNFGLGKFKKVISNDRPLNQ